MLTRQTLNVLIVDPLASDARRTAKAIQGATMNVSTVRVADGAVALRLMFERGLFTVSAQLPRLVVLEITAPNGKRMLRRIRDDARARGIPVIVLSTSASPEDIVDSYSLGAQAYIVKPADPLEYESEVACAARLWLAPPCDVASEGAGTKRQRGLTTYSSGAQSSMT